MRALELAGEPLQLFERAGVVGFPPRPAHPGLDLGAVAFGQMPEHVAFFVPEAALHRDLAEHRPHRLPERFGSVEDEQHALLGVKAAFDEV